MGGTGHNYYTAEAVYNGQHWDLQKWLLYRGDLIIVRFLCTVYLAE